MLRQRVATAAVLLGIIIGALFYTPPWFWGVLSLTTVAAAAWEWAMLIAREARPSADGFLMTALVVVAGLLYLAWRPIQAPVEAWVIGLSALNLVLWLALALPAVLTARLRGTNRLQAAAFAVLSMWCVWAAIFELRLVHPVLALSALSIIWFADIGAYFFGRAFGRRKLAVRVSPGKSWEGAIGGLVTVMVAAAIAWWVHPRDPVFSSALVAGAGPALALVGLTLIVALSVIGDLFESLLKRSKGVKDSGRLLPGHGGVLDRIDALVPTMPACLLLWAALAG